MVPTVVPAKFKVQQVKLVAFAHSSFAGGVELLTLTSQNARLPLVSVVNVHLKYLEVDKGVSVKTVPAFDVVMFVVLLFIVLKTVHELPSTDSSTVNISVQSLVLDCVFAFIL